MQKISAGKFHVEPPFTSFDHLVGDGEQREWEGKPSTCAAFMLTTNLTA
jgi:hypothetical protein